ncbi:MAG: hypothetical protein KC656_29235 [Myxococcales bacterium]|nr:hypothetical protein [Myxococcales bacterium]MCB9671663.1 hypothetical protein [Alphaproteobacteria bacterium]
MPDEEDAIKTQLMTRTRWLPPVEKVQDLPIDGVTEGTRCFVDGDGEVEEVREFRQGIWVIVDAL